MKKSTVCRTKLFLAVMLCTAPGSGHGQDVEITDGIFSPALVTVNQGSEVFWFNDGSEVHSTKAASGEWNSGQIQPLDYYSTMLTHTGSFPYACSQHPGETGTVTVVVAVIPPTVSVFYPASETRFGRPASFSFQVLASDSDGSVSNVTFLADGAVIGSDSGSPYNLPLVNLTAGNHVLSAQAMDNQGYVGTSAPVNITVTAPAGGATRYVDVQGGKFNPGMLNVVAGDTVIFRNLDPSNHTATGTFTSHEAFCGNTPLTATQSCTNTFNFPGSYTYFCGLHPSERGTVTVSQAMSPLLRLNDPSMDASGRFQFDLTSSSGLTCVIQFATNLPPTWTSIQTNLATNNLLHFAESQPASIFGCRFFRVQIQP